MELKELFSRFLLRKNELRSSMSVDKAETMALSELISEAKQAEEPRLRYKDMTDKTFGSLVAITPDHRDSHGRVYWLCQCVCGKQVKVRGNHLRNPSRHWTCKHV